MICKTIQHTKVLKYLQDCNKYYVPKNAPLPPNLVEPYRFMMKHYNYKHRPIFLAPVGYYVNFCGAALDNTCLITLDIPNRYIKIQDYYMWSDFIYFSEMPHEIQQTYNVHNVNELGRNVLGQFKGGIEKNDTVYQAITQFLLKSWVRKIERLTPEFIDAYIDTGGVNILK